MCNNCNTLLVTSYRYLFALQIFFELKSIFSFVFHSYDLNRQNVLLITWLYEYMIRLRLAICIVISQRR